MLKKKKNKWPGSQMAGENISREQQLYTGVLQDLAMFPFNYPSFAGNLSGFWFGVWFCFLKGKKGKYLVQ